MTEEQSALKRHGERLDEVEIVLENIQATVNKYTLEVCRVRDEMKNFKSKIEMQIKQLAKTNPKIAKQLEKIEAVEATKGVED